LGVKAYFPDGLKKDGAFGIGGELFLELDLGNGDYGLSFCDILMHNTADKGLMSKMIFGSKLGVPRVIKFLAFSNASGTKKMLQSKCTDNLKCLMFSHGKPVSEDAKKQLEAAISDL